MSSNYQRHRLQLSVFLRGYDGTPLWSAPSRNWSCCKPLSSLLYDDLAQQVDNKKYPPVLLVHGTDDVVVPFIMQEKSKAILFFGVEVDVVVCHQLGHGINCWYLCCD